MKFNRFYSPAGSHKLYSYLRCNFTVLIRKSRGCKHWVLLVLVQLCLARAPPPPPKDSGCVAPALFAADTGGCTFGVLCISCCISFVFFYFTSGSWNTPLQLCYLIDSYCRIINIVFTRYANLSYCSSKPQLCPCHPKCNSYSHEPSFVPFGCFQTYILLYFGFKVWYCDLS